MAIEQVIRSLQSQTAEGATSPQRRDLLRKLGQDVWRRLVEAADLDPHADGSRDKALSLVQSFLEQEESQNPLLVLSGPERVEIEERILTSIFGYGILTPFIQDDGITEIMVNGLDRIFVEKDGHLGRALDREGNPLAFRDKTEALTVIERIVSPLNRKVDEFNPRVDARLPDGSRVHIILPPVALDGPTITIRKFPKMPFTLERLVSVGALPQGLANWLCQLVQAKINLFISGGTSSGKTTVLNALSAAIPPHERVVTVEDAAELRLTHIENLVRLEARPANIEGKGEITIRDLVKDALRMRPDRIIVGECRGGEALDMLQAMNTGHDGSLTTGHANTPKDLISRLETMVLMSGMDLPVRAIRQQIASAIEIVVQLERRDGTRRLTEVSEVLGLDDGEIILEQLFVIDSSSGRLVWTGHELTRTGKFGRASMTTPKLGGIRL